jgi:DNA-binding NarL/FixJ family response regulator
MKYNPEQIEEIKSKHQSIIDQCNAYLLVLPKENYEAITIVDKLRAQVLSLYEELNGFYINDCIENNMNSELLTKREHQVLVQISLGQPNKEIAYQLSISPKTVQFHIKNLFEKLDATSRTEVVTQAIKLKLIDL